VAVNGESILPMLRLRTFGGLTLRLDGTPITGVVTQRRQLALLALLAVSGDDGMSRDKLLAYLWSERDEASARHLLNQHLYAQRRFAGDAGLFLGRKTLRLNPDLIESDVTAFGAALRVGEPERAVAEYRGPFLDGFFLAGAVEFETWVGEQRQRFARSCASVLDVLATGAAVRGDPEAACEWRRRAAELEPLDAPKALAFANALVNRGDRPGALRALLAHQDRVRNDLAVEPDPAVSRLIGTLGRSG
jgi:DNA-binding SARP family transcriptional activator